MNKIEGLTHLKNKLEAYSRDRSVNITTDDFLLAFESGKQLSLVLDAYRKLSVDAAIALHREVMPKIAQYSIVTDPTCLSVTVAGWPNGLSGDLEMVGKGWEMEEAAPAFVWALVEALLDREIKEQKLAA